MDDEQLKAEILEYALEQPDDVSVNIPRFADCEGYDESRCTRLVVDLYPYLEYGMSPRFPWVGHQQTDAIESKLADMENDE